MELCYVSGGTCGMFQPEGQNDAVVSQYVGRYV